MSTKSTLLCICAAGVIGVAVGRFSLPAKVVVKTQTVEVEKRVAVTDRAKQDNSVTTVTTTKKPDGTITTVTETRKDVHTDVVSRSKTDDTKDSRTEKTTTYDRGKFTISGLIITSPLSGQAPMAYGLDVSYRVLGPFSVNALGATNGLVGIGLGVSF